jgi:hypothetical protein
VRYKCNSKHKRIMQSTIDIQESRTEVRVTNRRILVSVLDQAINYG